MVHTEDAVTGYFKLGEQNLAWINNQLSLDVFRSLMVLVVFVPSALLKPELGIIWFGYLPYLIISLFLVFLSWKGVVSRIRFWIFLILDSLLINVFAHVIGVGLVPIGIAMIPLVLAYTTSGGEKEGLVACFLILGSFAGVIYLENLGILTPMKFADKSLPEFTSPGGPLGAWLIISGVLVLIYFWISNLMNNLEKFNRQIIHAYNEEQEILQRSAKLSRALRQTEKLEGFGKLAGSVAHDFNSLLTVIQGFTNEILENEHIGKAIESDLLEVKKAAARTGELTDKLLAFSRRQDVEAQPLEINELIKNFQQLISPIIGEGISVSIALVNKPLWVNGDKKRIEQLLMALAINSKDAMPEGGRISIKTRKVKFKDGDTGKPPSLPTGEYVEVIFSDNGLGMSGEVHARAFEPFYTTKAQGEGSGLGLSVAYGIVRQHGGEIRAETAEGKGTVMRIFFPGIPEWSGADI